MKIRFWLASLFLVFAISPLAYAGGKHQGWKDTSDVGVMLLLASSVVVAPATHDDWQGFREAALSDGIAEGGALLGKSLIHEERPDHSDDKSFPSGHATLAFAAATTMYRRYGWRWGVPAYAIATVVGVARVAARKHHWWDVVAGAAIGTGSGWLVTHPLNNRNVTVAPWVGDGGGGIAVAVNW